MILLCRAARFGSELCYCKFDKKFPASRPWCRLFDSLIVQAIRTRNAHRPVRRPVSANWSVLAKKKKKKALDLLTRLIGSGVGSVMSLPRVPPEIRSLPNDESQSEPSANQWLNCYKILSNERRYVLFVIMNSNLIACLI